MANDTEYGLSSYVFTRDLARTIRLAEALDFGMVGVNTGLVSNPAAPFGGVKASGFGREGGFEGIEEYLDTTYVALNIDELEPYDGVAAQYVDFAEHCEGESPCFVEWGRGVADDPEVLAWVDELPGLKKQPNIVFAAARWHGVPAPGPYAGLREALLADDGTIRATILARSTQTNEVGRLATLLPAFAQAVPTGPVALIEAGASAGLNLFPERWGYAWIDTGRPGRARRAAVPALRGDRPGTAARHALPEVAWRGGVDLNPLDVTDPEATAWLENLVWPEEEDRRERLRHAVGRRGGPAAAGPGRPARGAARARGRGLGARHRRRVPQRGGGLPAAEARARFQELMLGLVADGACHWVSNEGPTCFPTSTSPPRARPTRRALRARHRRAAGRPHPRARAVPALV